MSRGPGFWQRLLLDALEGTEAVSVSSAPWAASDSPTRSDFVAVRRAAATLAQAGKVRAIYRYLPTRDERRMTPRLVVTRPDSTMPGNVAKTRPTPEWVTDPPPGAELVMSTRTVGQILGVSASTVSRDRQRTG